MHSHARTRTYMYAHMRAGKATGELPTRYLIYQRQGGATSEPCSKIKVCFNKSSQPMVAILELLRMLPGKHL